MGPETPDWLNAEFMQKVLVASENEKGLKVKGITSKPATAKGDNYTSDMIRVMVDYSYEKNGRKTEEKKSLIVKIAPTAEGVHKELIKMVGLFDTEIRMMETTLKEMNNLVAENGYRLGARVLYTHVGDPSLLVIEDLAPLGFRMADRQAGLDLQHCLLAMRGLAKFHASSVALLEKEPKHASLYQKGIFAEGQPEEMMVFFTGGVKALSQEVSNWPELGPGYAEKFEKLIDCCYVKAARTAMRRDDEFNVINHGDFWVNNMLFRYNQDGTVSDHIFVDFQLCVYASPAIDLQYFLNTSPSDEVELNHRGTLLEEYLSTLGATLSKLGCKTKPPTMATLQKSMEEREFYGILSACTILPLVLTDKSEAKSLDEILVEGGYENPAYKSALYRKTMVRRLPKWNAKGLLDV